MQAEQSVPNDGDEIRKSGA